MVQAVPGLDTAAISANLDNVEAGWTAGAPFIGQLAKGPDLDPTIAQAPEDDDDGN
jgi:hypothetical protein